MRLVRFEDESGGFAVDLHPLITVISGLPAHVRERLVHGLAALPRGTDPGGRGSIEVHGVHLDLNRESLELLELNQDLDVILRSSDLPGSELITDEPSFDDLYADSSSADQEDDEVREARRLVQEHDEAYDAAVQAVEMYRSQLAEIEAEQGVLNQQLGDARVGLDSFAAAGLKIAGEELADLTTPVGAAASSGAAATSGQGSMAAAPSTAAPSSPAPSGRVYDAETLDAERARIEGRLTFLIDESDRLKRAIRALRAIDPDPVRAAYAATEGAVDASDRDDDIEIAETADHEEASDLHDTTATADTTDTTDSDEVAAPVIAAPEPAPSPEAEALAAEWEAIEDRLTELGPPRDHGRERLDALTSHRDAAYDAMKLAERNLRSPELDPALVDRLESIHDEIFELDGKSSRFGAGKNRRRLESLRTEESTVLGQLGFETWSSYIMGITSAGSDPSRRRDHENAVRAYEQAETELAHAANEPIAVEIDPEYDDLARARDDLSRRISTLLGTDAGGDPVPALRAIRIAPAPLPTPEPVPAPTPAPAPVAAFVAPEREARVAAPVSAPAPGPVSAAAAERLYEALAATGATLPDGDLSVLELRSLAAGWLETMDELPERIAQATGDRDTIEDEITVLAVELDDLPDEPDTTSSAFDPGPEPEAFVETDLPEPEETPELIEARARVAEAESRVRAHEEAVARIADIESHHERIVERSRDLNRSLAEREPRVALLLEQRVAARNRLRRAENNRSTVESARWENRHQNTEETSRFLGGSAGAEAVEWYVLARLAQQRSVSFVGSVPLVIDDAFSNWPVEALGDVFARLERMGEVIQIVYLTDDPDVGAWARSLGSDRALVLDMRVAS